MFWSAQELEEAERLRNKELVTTNTPRNVTDLALSLIGDEYKIATPIYRDGVGVDEAKASKARSGFLTALWKCHRYVGQQDAFDQLKWNMVVKGRGALQVSWIKERTPKPLQWYRPPILFRSLNPQNVGYLEDEVGLRAAYHTYDVPVYKLVLQYPEAKNLKEIKDKDRKDIVKFTDYWTLDDDGNVHNCFLVNNCEFLRPLQKSKVPIIPIIIRGASSNPVDDIRYQNVSILDGIMTEWESENMLESMLMTGVAKSFWPTIYAADDSGEPIPDIQTGPDAVNEVSRTFRFVNGPDLKPDFQSAASISDRVSERIQNGSFSRSLYGNASGERSGFMFNLVVQAGMGRMGKMIGSLERMMSEANSLALCMVHKFSPSGEKAYMYSTDNGEMEAMPLNPEDIHDTYENHVTIKPTNRLSDDLQRLALALQLVNSKIVSPDTVRERLLPFAVPDDEDDRIFTNAALNDPDLLKARIRDAYKKHYGVDLPPSEPDMKETPQAAPPPQQGLQPPPMAPGMNLPPQMQGQIPPEALMGGASPSPVGLDAAMGQPVTLGAIQQGLG